ncbi:HVO_0234 family beta-propeller protein [Halocatena pleomorpha]|uniref:HVO-0234-like beta-propeller domain-containing protein n=1 Tax=Halocatena pleomorpha TaxID=1785090 RepID=A0A3P3RCJ9_9EURY|nr:hypothetical protein [Halocatena pleomorpha]RRJ31054.1 hypothetical protein EIK79_08585 [Halocatena pleomorpha]
MSSIEEKRVFDTSTGKTDVFVATGLGIARVECSGGLVGGFELVHQCTATDIATAGGRIAVGTETAVLVWRDGDFVATGFRSQTDQQQATERNPVSAVGFSDGLVAAGPTRIARHTDGTWRDLRVEGTDSDVPEVNAFAGPLVATDAGVYRVENESLSSVGLEDVRDVSVAGTPLAGTETGLYRLENGWEPAFEKSVHCLASDGNRVHVGTDEGVFVRSKRPESSEQWERVALPTPERIAGIAYGESTYAVTVDGTFLVESEDEWRARSLGLPAVSGIVVP